MSWLEDIQKLPQEKKFRIIWMIAAGMAVILILLWIISARWQKKVASDKTLFNAIEQGAQNVKENYKK